MAGKKGKGGKADNCWSCGTRLDQPFNGMVPRPHGCGKTDCVECPKCGAGICEYSEVEKEEKAKKAERMKAMGKGPAKGKAKQKAGTGGSPSGPDAPDASDGRIHLPAVEPFPVEVFPQLLQRYIREGSRALGAPADYFGNTMIAVAASACGIRREIVVKESFSTVPCIYAANVGLPGSAKSPAQDRVLRPVREREEELLHEYRKERKQFEREMQEYKTAKKEVKKQVGGEPADSLQACLQHLDCPREPRRERVYTNDITVESLTEIMRDNPEGVGLFRDELVAWVRSCDMYRAGRGTDRQFYLTCWSALSYPVDRKSDKQRGETIFIPKTFLCVVGGLTPDMVGEFTDEHGRNDGFLDRILCVYPDGQGLAAWTEDTISDGAEAAWRKALHFLWDMQCKREGPKYISAQVGISDSGKKVFIEHYDRLGREASAPDFPPYLRGVWSKFRVYLARFALVVHLLRCALQEVYTDELVDETSVRGAVALVEYYASHAVRIHALLQGGKKVSQADALLARVVAEVVGACGGRWQGTATALLAEVCRRQPAEAANLPDWPGSPDSTGRAVRRVAGHLKDAHKIEYVPGVRDKDKSRTRLIVLNKLSEASKASASGTSPSPANSCASDTSTDTSGDAEGSVRTSDTPDTSVRQAPEDVSGNQTVSQQGVTDAPDAPDTSDASGAGTEGTSALPEVREEGDA
jgi:hypothetical protein